NPSQRNVLSETDSETGLGVETPGCAEVVSEVPEALGLEVVPGVFGLELGGVDGVVESVEEVPEAFEVSEAPEVLGGDPDVEESIGGVDGTVLDVPELFSVGG